MLRVRAIISSACVLALLSLLTTAHPVSARGGYQMCNRTSEKLFLAIAYYSGDRDFFVSEGWWTLTPGVCARVFPNRSFEGHRYYYAQTENKSSEWTSDNGVQVCIDPHNKFTIAHADSGSACPSPYVRQKFHYFSDADPLNLTLDTPAAGGQPAPSAPSGGACLRAANDRDYKVSFTVDGWPGSYWEAEPMDVMGLYEGHLFSNGAPVKSSTGRFSIRGYRGSDVSNVTWKFDPNDTLDGCNGTWTVTFK